MTDDGVIRLHSNAAVAFFIRRAVRLLPLIVLSLVFLLIPSCHAGVTVNGHPATQANYEFLNKMRWVVPLIMGFILVILWFYCIFLARSYVIRLTKDGIVLNYGILNLKSETLLFTKIQDLLINRNVLERMCGISTVSVQNAMGKPEIIPGLGIDAAESLRATIISHITR